jgi:thiosulfate/3-mercaptopyruvate sulfurtransferase
MRSTSLALILLAFLAPAAQGQQARLLVSTQWLEENLSSPNLVVLHASQHGDDFGTGHIPGARLVTLDRITWDGETGVGMEIRTLAEIRGVLREAGVSNQSTVVVYGADPISAARLWMTLDVVGAGRSEPLFLDGGFNVWQAEGRPVSTETPRVARGNVTLRPDPGKLASADWILVRLGHDDLSLVDARPKAQFSGADGGQGGRVNPGHIPSARQLQWEELVESMDRPIFRPVNELADLFIEAGADPGDTVVTYGEVGLKASITYMIARMLGYQTRFFDGSWQAWSALDYPYYPRRAEPSSPAGR